MSKTGQLLLQGYTIGASRCAPKPNEIPYKKYLVKTMRWTSSLFKAEMSTLFGIRSKQKATVLSKTTRDIKEAMLAAMGSDVAVRFHITQLRVTHTDDIQDLWYLRGDVMLAISSTAGEAFARKKIADISEMFAGLIPTSLMSKGAYAYR